MTETFPTTALPQIEFDRALVRRIALVLQVLHVPLLRRLTIEAQEGVVTLRGRVATYYQRQIAYSAARRVPGVVRVIDEIDVDRVPLPAFDRFALRQSA